jgi:signal transduction histidine kinase
MPQAHLDGRAEARWLALYVAARLVASAFAAALIVWGGIGRTELLLLLYGPLSTAAIVTVPPLRSMRLAWAADFAITLGLVLASGDWRSAFYLLWLAALALPATLLSLRRALLLAVAAPLAFLVVAVVGGPAPGSLAITSTETLGIHLSLPFLLVCSLAYAADALRRLARERSARERLAIEAERRRIAWELHDSAKQRLHAAHLLVSALQGRVPADLEPPIGRAVVELESAASDMDTSLAELRSPLEGRTLEEALRRRAGELAGHGTPVIRVSGSAPPLPPLVGAHVYRIACEAMTNALRHADATTIDVSIATAEGRLRLAVVDDGRGIPAERRSGATGLLAMENRAATIGASLTIAPGDRAQGSAVELEVDVNQNGGSHGSSSRDRRPPGAPRGTADGPRR